MTRVEVIQKALAGKLNWVQAGVVMGVTARHLYRLRLQYEEFGIPGLKDKRAGRRMPQRIPPETVEELCRFKREVYPDFSVRHFHEFATEKHGLKVSYTMTLTVLQAKGLVTKEPGRGKYRRKRERRPMVGMLVHMDASTHEWIPGLRKQDLFVALDDADGRILFARFFEQEGTVSTLVALEHVLVGHGRFCELYTDRGSHFCRTPTAGGEPTLLHDGQVPRVLRTLGIRQILARSPEARGRSERAFGTIQGRLPQELRVAGIRTYEAANEYLERSFLPDFNKRFTVTPAQPERAFLPLTGIDLKLLLSVQHERVVAKDSTVAFEGLTLQLPPGRDRLHYVRCPVTVHELLDAHLAVSYQGRLLARFTREGELLGEIRRAQRKAA